MPSDAHQAFETFRGRVALTESQRSAIKSRRDAIRNYLAADGWVIETVVFGGSHARATKVRLPGNAKGDVDIYVVLDRRYKDKYGGLFQPAPKQLLSDFKVSLDKKLTTPSVRADSPAVRISYKDMLVDVVPAFRRPIFGGYDIPYYDRWMVATPEAQRASFSKLNSQTGYRAVPLVRMLKFWKARHGSFPLRSYHLEVMAYEIFRRHGLSDYRSGILEFFTQAQLWVRSSLSDPGGSGNSVSAYMTTAQRDRAVAMFATGAARARAAIDKPTWEAEINAWRADGLFGERFPTYSS
ncbi:MAG: SMODS domain-containing nucleotidyltransferase [Solirubrobacteraceae bacterium]